MKISYVHSRVFPSVDANVVQVVQTCRAFAALGHDITLLIPRSEDYSSDNAALDSARAIFGESLPFNIVFVPRVRMFGRLEVLGTVRGTLRELRKLKQDLIYTRNPWLVPFLPRLRTPFIFEAHESQVHRTSKFLGAILQGMIVKASRTKELVKVVTISEALKNVWMDYGVPEEKLLAAHDGVDLDWAANAPDKDTARQKLNIALDAKAVIYTGALHHDRGIDLILQSAKELSRLSFFIVGGLDDQVEYWKKEADRMNLANVIFTGRVSHRDIPTWLSAADILLMMWTWQVPTIRICSPMKLFEYMAANRHIVGPAFPTVLEVLQPDREAILFEPDNLAEMISAIRKAETLLSDSTMPKLARQKIEKEYTWKKRCGLILESLKPIRSL